jgi:hypothetical protein
VKSTGKHQNGVSYFPTNSKLPENLAFIAVHATDLTCSLMKPKESRGTVTARAG